MADLNGQDCTHAVESAVKAAPTLRSKTGKERGEMLEKWHSALVAARDELATIVTAENGKPRVEAVGEIDYAAGFLSWFAGAARRVEGTVSCLTYSIIHPQTLC